jgi:hypothetical protein
MANLHKIRGSHEPVSLPHKEVHMSIEIFTRELHYKQTKTMNITVKNKVLWARLALISCIILLLAQLIKRR